MTFWEAQKRRLIQYLEKECKKGPVRGVKIIRYMQPEVQPGALLGLMGSLFAEKRVFSPRPGYYKLIEQ